MVGVRRHVWRVGLPLSLIPAADRSHRIQCLSYSKLFKCHCSVLDENFLPLCFWKQIQEGGCTTGSREKLLCLFTQFNKYSIYEMLKWNQHIIKTCLQELKKPSGNVTGCSTFKMAPSKLNFSYRRYLHHSMLAFSLLFDCMVTDILGFLREGCVVGVFKQYIQLYC